MKTIHCLLNLSAGFLTLTAISGGNLLASINPAQAELPKDSTRENILLADARVTPPALIGVYTGVLRPAPGATCSLPAIAMTVIVANNSTAWATSGNAAGPSGTAQLSTSTSPPIIAGEYSYGGSQGFWQGQIIGTQITGIAGAATCRFTFTLPRKP